jgi:hypothetical protein
VQNSPLQSGHVQPWQAHESDETAVLALAQHECLGVLFSSVALERQPQFSHSHGSQVQNSPLQSGHLQSSQVQPWFASAFAAVELRAVAESVSTKPTNTTANRPATRMEIRFMVESFRG